MKNYIQLSTLILSSLLLICCQSTKSNKDYFRSAEPVWPEGRQYEKNLSIAFISGFEAHKNQNTFLKVAASSLYRIYLNDDFVGHGPARAGHGYYRVDEWDLSDHLNDSLNILKIEVASYNVNSFYLLDQPGFLQAEVISGTKIISATSDRNDDFAAFEMKERVQKVPRYSFQRPFIEYYRISDTPSPLARGDTGGYKTKQ